MWSSSILSSKTHLPFAYLLWIYDVTSQSISMCKDSLELVTITLTRLLSRLALYYTCRNNCRWCTDLVFGLILYSVGKLCRLSHWIVRLDINLRSIVNIFSSSWWNNSIELRAANCSSILLKETSKLSISSAAASSAIIRSLRPNIFFFFFEVWKKIDSLYSSVMQGTQRLKKQGALFNSLWSCSFIKLTSILISNNKHSLNVGLTFRSNFKIISRLKDGKNSLLSQQNAKVVGASLRLTSLDYAFYLVQINLVVVSTQRYITFQECCWSFIYSLTYLAQKGQTCIHLIHHIKAWIFSKHSQHMTRRERK